MLSLCNRCESCSLFSFNSVNKLSKYWLWSGFSRLLISTPSKGQTHLIFLITTEAKLPAFFSVPPCRLCYQRCTGVAWGATAHSTFWVSHVKFIFHSNGPSFERTCCDLEPFVVQIKRLFLLNCQNWYWWYYCMCVICSLWEAIYHKCSYM